MEDGTAGIASDLLVIAIAHWSTLQGRTLQTVDAYHKAFPLRRGIPREELKSKLKLSPRVFNAVVNQLTRKSLLIERSAFLAKPEHQVTFDKGQQARVESLKRRFEQNPFNPPGVRESEAEVGEEVLNALIDMGHFTPVSTDVIFRKQDYDSSVTQIRETLVRNERITLAEVRDLLGTSRKYAQALLEHLDAAGITMRDGDYRKLKRR
jgi:selenocysteine-specific elongation factor